MVAIDGRKLYNSGYYLTYDEGEYKSNRAGDTYEISEEVWTGFVKADYQFEAGSTLITGNLGLQAVNSDQGAEGFEATGSSGGVVATPVSASTSYTDWLPSFNMTIAITDDQAIRLGASRTMTRTRMDDLKPGTSVVFTPDNNIEGANLERSPWSATTGNPYLEPIKVDQYDLAWEWYFAADGYVSAAYFLKDLVNWQTTTKVAEDFTPFYYPELGTVYTFDGYYETTVETQGGQIDGFELQAALPFSVFTEALDGFGLLGHYTWLNNDLKINGSVASVIGLSEESWGLTAYFERAGFQARVSGQYRSDYTAEIRGGNNGLTTDSVLDTELWDAEISYDFGKGGFSGAWEGLSVFLSGTNLTNEPYVQYTNSDPRQITRYSNYGTNYMLGASYRF
jgi:iron complex outermembrane receptor protein